MTVNADALPVSFADVEAAHARIAEVVHRTPIVRCRTLDARAAGALVRLKCENFQRAGAFKFRGATNAIRSLDDDARARGVVTWSSGNHAQALALAGQLHDVPVTIVMPHNAPAVKLAATRGYGGNVVLYDPDEAVREEVGRELAAEKGLAIIPPYDHAHIVAGAGTVAKELHEDSDAPLDLLLAPCGGGGLLAGCSVASKAIAPGCRVIGVEPEQADDAVRSFRTGTLHTVHNPDTIADGARTPYLGQINFRLIRAHVDDMVTVSEAAILEAMLLLWERAKLVVEPTGAVATAALLSGAVRVEPGQRVGVVISGGNVDLRQAADLLAQAPVR